VSVAVQCHGVSKSYARFGMMGVKEFLVGKRRHVGRFMREWALHDVSLQVSAGQAFGVIGHNGSGKSTLLALMLGVIRPDAGSVEVRGRVASLLALGAGFHPELTGRQNVMLYGSILGMSLREIRAAFDGVLEFSELGDAIDNPLRTYSSGMITRLGFSTIIHAPADVLLIDEVLAVGDMEFQARCTDALARFKRRGGTLVIVSHDLGAIQRMCDQALCLEEGRVVSAGAARQVVHCYTTVRQPTRVTPHPA
jgi:ABC-type polysaccharide/polyol phosphate transport system ATPase subunit